MTDAREILAQLIFDFDEVAFAGYAKHIGPPAYKPQRWEDADEFDRADGFKLADLILAAGYTRPAPLDDARLREIEAALTDDGDMPTNTPREAAEAVGLPYLLTALRAARERIAELEKKYKLRCEWQENAERVGDEAVERAEAAEARLERAAAALRGVSIMLKSTLKEYADEPWAQRVSAALNGDAQ